MQHTGLTVESWGAMPFLKRLSNIGSEVQRAIKWKDKSNLAYGDLAFIRALELFDLTYKTELTNSQLNELCRLREAWIDFYKYQNEYKTDSKFWQNYFDFITVRSL
jgi:hypothetical protein